MEFGKAMRSALRRAEARGDRPYKSVRMPPHSGEGSCAALAASVMRFFEAAPDEELTIADAALKFDAPYSRAQEVLSGLTTAGRLAVRREGKPNVYSFVPGHPAVSGLTRLAGERQWWGA